MKKSAIVVALMLVLMLAVNAMADPVTTMQKFWSSIFVDGDLKHAFALLATEDQQFIKTTEPELYSIAMGDFGQETGELGMIFSAFQKIIFNTLGKVIRIEDVKLGERDKQGQQVSYSLKLAADLESYVQIAKYLEEQTKKFENGEDSAFWMDQVKTLIDGLSQKLSNISFKTSISYNSFAVIVLEDGQERILFNLAMQQEKLRQLGIED